MTRAIRILHIEDSDIFRKMTASCSLRLVPVQEATNGKQRYAHSIGWAFRHSGRSALVGSGRGPAPHQNGNR